MTATASYSWLKRLSPEFVRKDEVPLFGYPPPFPWEAFAQQLAQTFQLKEVTFTPSMPEWREAKSLFSDFGEPFIARELRVSSIDGPIWWVMSQQDLLFLMGFLLKKQTHPEFEADPDFLSAFVQFLSLEVIHAFKSVEFDHSLSIQIKDPSSQPEESALCLDVTAKVSAEHAVKGRLVLSEPFYKQWKAHYAQVNANAAYQAPNADYLEVIVHLEAGKTTLKAGEWKKMAPGDLLILDSCTLKPGDNNGRVLLTINGKPFFRGKLKQGNLKILEYPLYHEVTEPMAKNHSDYDDDEFDEHEDSEFNETEEEETDSDYDEDDEYTDHEDEEEEYTDDDSLMDQEEVTESETHEDEISDVEESTEHEAEEDAQVETEKEAVPATKQAAPSIDDIPVVVTAEVGRIQMTVKKLVELQPGNLLELNVHPEDGIDLVVNGKRVARGELLTIGEALGVRVLEIG
ncbi:type III secretion system cytoplasmic ring protein SctQ [Parachlamydia sp. AcF125]|uniref:type III secretion system cytoplasmic ring protein SctQ n=1 Tax=Parachlamydia sp. AcF125 TaxID=2795736 RepID=UPI001BC9DBE7|nr:type III secretion system cytoplasmic ring protein SctQ [Parachlamydia sp. AcF125]MBS4168170.1 Flagellar motor switch protein FliN [Parachlamydia sp. AcF125]